MDEDPISQFFPDQDTVDLYEVLTIQNDALAEEIKKAYRRLALVHHPDKHATATAAAKAEASTKFQQVGFAYAVLSDPKRKERYDKTGRTDEGFELVGEDGWEAYFDAMFERVTAGKLDDMKKEYQGSAEEIEDLKTAYLNSSGSIGEIMTHVPHSTFDDEARFIIIISDLIKQGTLPALDNWDATVKDEAAKLIRKKRAQKEAKEAEQLAGALGVWDDFYGSGAKKKEPKRGKGKDQKNADEEEDNSVLQALILKKQKNMDGFFDSLAVKYAEPTSGRSKGKKRARQDDSELGDEGTSAAKKSRATTQSMPDIEDEEFARLQEKLFGGKESSKPSSSKSKSSRGRAKKGKSR